MIAGNQPICFCDRGKSSWMFPPLQEITTVFATIKRYNKGCPTSKKITGVAVILANHHSCYRDKSSRALPWPGKIIFALIERYHWCGCDPEKLSCNLLWSCEILILALADENLFLLLVPTVCFLLSSKLTLRTNVYRKFSAAWYHIWIVLVIWI